MRTAHSVLAMLAMACASDPTASSGVQDYEIDVSGERFIVRTGNTTTIQALDRRLASRQVGVITGDVGAGDGGFNAPGHWYLTPTSVQVVDAAIELCDGRPSHIESDVAGWIRRVKQYCPWTAVVVRRR